MKERNEESRGGYESPGAGFPVSQGREKWDWRVVLLELVIVFVGLFAALQVDSYREQRQFEATQQRYLQRLRTDLAGYIELTRPLLEFLELNRQANDHVFQSLDAGEILDGNKELFDHGLIYFGHLPSSTLPRATYDEMVASGMFSALQSEELKSRVSELFWRHESVERNFSWWRADVPSLSQELYKVVRFKSGPLTDNPAFETPEVQRFVEYDFDVLAANSFIVNGFYWMSDTASDWDRLTAKLLELAQDALQAIDQELGVRGQGPGTSVLDTGY